MDRRPGPSAFVPDSIPRIRHPAEERNLHGAPAEIKPL
tara:strand:- start:7553 stop:7666 length:114 start_codon:yes stop_codon:yes gene_type:complete